MKIDSIIFDIDGTLWDVRDEIAASLTEGAHMAGHPEVNFTLENLSPIFGSPLPLVADFLISHLPPEERYALMEKCGENQVTYVKKRTADKTYPGVADVMAQLSKDYPLFIVSNCPTGYIPAFMERGHVTSYVRDYEEQGRTGLSKGENIKLIMERNHLCAPVYIGDTKGDEEAAAFAGIPFLWASYGFGTVEDPAYVIKNFEEIPQKIAKIEAE